MTFQDFKNTFDQNQPPSNFSILLKSLWYEGKGDWQTAHDLVDSLNSRKAAWVHAYLHRVEGDNWNANYWYRNAGKQMPKVSLKEEWEVLVKAFL